MKTNKYRNIKVPSDGHVFGGVSEARRYHELKLLKRAGEITNLEIHKKHPLYVKDIKVGDYEADFDYDCAYGTHVTEDVKSIFTAKLPLFRLKAKMFKAYYNYEITEVVRRGGSG